MKYDTEWKIWKSESHGLIRGSFSNLKSVNFAGGRSNFYITKSRDFSANMLQRDSATTSV